MVFICSRETLLFYICFTVFLVWNWRLVHLDDEHDCRLCDLDELQNGLPRKEATFGAIYWLMVKFGYAIAGLLSGLIMTLVGFDPNIPEQPEGAVFWLRVVYSVFPILGTLLAIYVMRNYEISEERAMEIKTQLRDKKLKKE